MYLKRYLMSHLIEEHFFTYVGEKRGRRRQRDLQRHFAFFERNAKGVLLEMRCLQRLLLFTAIFFGDFFFRS